METTIATPTPTPTTTVQHITKVSSDELLSKFAELDSPDDHRSKKSLRLFKRQKRAAQLTPPVTRRESSEFAGGTILAERKSLLPPVVSARRYSGTAALVRQLKFGRSNFRARNFRKRSFFGTIEKTWQRTLDGASNVFMEKQYNRHKHLLICSPGRWDSKPLQTNDSHKIKDVFLGGKDSHSIMATSLLARMNKDDNLDDDRDPLIFGEFSFACVQASEVLEDHSPVEIDQNATFVGVYDGHGGRSH
ncbi:hypothetical protein L1987_21412 [Smallanthus sonchifolius]|uniref:Uncharacterized protein n=1 Tax=Smallanthus sonchifolius TaxID=185202 RepID=A0ACB9IUU2_9ASTR|nr:hypothetical protein L1987_21412 [Smallanthus sonchifolius]